MLLHTREQDPHPQHVFVISYLEFSTVELASYNDSLEEVFENREQIEISRYYEKLPKPTLLATEEFVEGNVYWRDPSRESNIDD